MAFFIQDELLGFYNFTKTTNLHAKCNEIRIKNIISLKLSLFDGWFFLLKQNFATAF